MALSFGLSVPEAPLVPAIDQMLKWVSNHVGTEVVRRDAANYEALANDMRKGELSLAWLPPVVFVRLGEEIALPLVSMRRGASTGFQTALVVNNGSPIQSVDQLTRARAAWVDPWSASGFVLPRIHLSLLGKDPRTVFRTESFHGSHYAAIRAVMDGAADVAGTYAHTGEDGEVKGGGWSDVGMGAIRVLKTLGEVPADLICVHRNVDPETRAKLLKAFMDVSADPQMRPLVKSIFGGEEFREGTTEGYDGLRKVVSEAESKGLFA